MNVDVEGKVGAEEVEGLARLRLGEEDEAPYADVEGAEVLWNAVRLLGRKALEDEAPNEDSGGSNVMSKLLSGSTDGVEFDRGGVCSWFWFLNGEEEIRSSLSPSKCLSLSR